MCKGYRLCLFLPFWYLILGLFWLCGILGLFWLCGIFLFFILLQRWLRHKCISSFTWTAVLYQPLLFQIRTEIQMRTEILTWTNFHHTELLVKLSVSFLIVDTFLYYIYVFEIKMKMDTKVIILKMIYYIYSLFRVVCIKVDIYVFYPIKCYLPNQYKNSL